MKEIRNGFFWNVSAEVNRQACGLCIANRLPISRLRVMIGAGNDEPGIWDFLQCALESLHQSLQPLIGPPVSDRQNAEIRIAALREIWRAGKRSKRSMGAKEHVLSRVLGY